MSTAIRNGIRFLTIAVVTCKEETGGKDGREVKRREEKRREEKRREEKRREAHLTDKAKTLEPQGLNRRDKQQFLHFWLFSYQPIIFI